MFFDISVHSSSITWLKQIEFIYSIVRCIVILIIYNYFCQFIISIVNLILSWDWDKSKVTLSPFINVLKATSRGSSLRFCLYRPRLRNQFFHLDFFQYFWIKLFISSVLIILLIFWRDDGDSRTLFNLIKCHFVYLIKM